MSERALCTYCGGSQDVMRFDDKSGQILSEVCLVCHGKMFKQAKWPTEMPVKSTFDALTAALRAIEKCVRNRE